MERGRFFIEALKLPAKEWSPMQDDAVGCRPWPSERQFQLWLMLIACVAAVMAGYHLDRPMQCDESISFMDYIRHGLVHVLTHYEEPNNHVLHNLLACAATDTFGDAPLSVRLVAFLAGVAGIIVTGFLGKALLDGLAGLLAASLVGGSLVYLDFMVNARGYTIVCSCTGSALLAVARGLRGWKWQSLYITAVAAGIFTVPTMLLPVCSVMLFGLLQAFVSQPLQTLNAFNTAGRLVIHTLIAAVVGFALYLPILLHNGPGALFANAYVQALDPADFANRSRDLLHAIPAFTGMDSSIVSRFCGCLGLAGLLVCRPIRLKGVLLMASFVAGPLIVILLMSTVPPARSLLYLVPVSAVLIGAGLRQLIGVMAPGHNCGAVVLLFGLANLAATGIALVGKGTLGTGNWTGIADGAPRFAARIIAATSDQRTGAPNILAGYHAIPPVRYYLLRGGCNAQVGFHSADAETWLLVHADPIDNPQRIGRFLGAALPPDLAGWMLERDRECTIYRLPGGAVKPLEGNYLWANERVTGLFARQSAWFGSFTDFDFPWIQHQQHGPLYCVGSDVDSIWIWDAGLGEWWHTNRGLYPRLFLGKSNPVMLRFETGSRHPDRRFMDESTSRLVTEEELARRIAEGAGRQSSPN